MVDRVEHTRGQFSRGAEQQSRLAAIGTDLDSDAAIQIAHRGVVQGLTLVAGHEALHLLGKREQALGRVGVVIAHQVNLSGASTAPTSWSPYLLDLLRHSSVWTGVRLRKRHCADPWSAVRGFRNLAVRLAHRLAVRLRRETSRGDLD